MNDLKKHALALSFIAILLAIKLVFIPLIDWQNEQLAKIALLEKRTNKIERLITNKDELLLQNNQIKNNLIALSLNFFEIQPPEEFKRAQQKIVEEQLENYNLKIKNIGWQTTILNQDAPVRQFNLEYSFEGNGEDVFKYIVRLSSDVKFTNFTEYTMSFSRQKPNKLGKIIIRVRREFFMKTEELNLLLNSVKATENIER